MRPDVILINRFQGSRVSGAFFLEHLRLMDMSQGNIIIAKGLYFISLYRNMLLVPSMGDQNLIPLLLPGKCIIILCLLNLAGMVAASVYSQG